MNRDSFVVIGCQCLARCSEVSDELKIFKNQLNQSFEMTYME